MKKIIYLLVLLVGSTNAFTIKIFNNTGATLHAKARFLGCKDHEFDITGPKSKTDIGYCCLVGLQLAVVNGPYQGQSTVITGKSKFCRDYTFEVEIKNNRLTWFRK